jgi:hypothetical protein
MHYVIFINVYIYKYIWDHTQLIYEYYKLIEAVQKKQYAIAASTAEGTNKLDIN